MPNNSRLRVPEWFKDFIEDQKDNKNQSAVTVLGKKYPDLKKDLLKNNNRVFNDKELGKEFEDLLD